MNTMRKKIMFITIVGFSGGLVNLILFMHFEPHNTPWLAYALFLPVFLNFGSVLSVPCKSYVKIPTAFFVLLVSHLSILFAAFLPNAPFCLSEIADLYAPFGTTISALISIYFREKVHRDQPEEALRCSNCNTIFHMSTVSNTLSHGAKNHRSFPKQTSIRFHTGHPKARILLSPLRDSLQRRQKREKYRNYRNGIRFPPSCLSQLSLFFHRSPIRRMDLHVKNRPFTLSLPHRLVCIILLLCCCNCNSRIQKYIHHSYLFHLRCASHSSMDTYTYSRRYQTLSTKSKAQSHLSSYFKTYGL